MGLVVAVLGMLGVVPGAYQHQAVLLSPAIALKLCYLYRHANTLCSAVCGVCLLPLLLFYITISKKHTLRCALIAEMEFLVSQCVLLPCNTH